MSRIRARLAAAREKRDAADLEAAGWRRGRQAAVAGPFASGAAMTAAAAELPSGGYYDDFPDGRRPEGCGTIVAGFLVVAALGVAAGIPLGMKLAGVLG